MSGPQKCGNEPRTEAPFPWNIPGAGKCVNPLWEMDVQFSCWARGNPDHRLCPPRSHPCPFLSVLVLTPVQPHPYTFRGFSHVLPTPQNSLPSSGLFRLKLRNSSRRPALPDRSSSPGLAAPCVGHTCVTPTEPDQGLCFVPPATRCMPASQLSHLVLWLSTFSSVFPPDTGFLERTYYSGKLKC